MGIGWSNPPPPCLKITLRCRKANQNSTCDFSPIPVFEINLGGLQYQESVIVIISPSLFVTNRTVPYRYCTNYLLYLVDEASLLPVFRVLVPWEAWLAPQTDDWYDGDRLGDHLHRLAPLHRQSWLLRALGLQRCNVIGTAIHRHSTCKEKVVKS